MFLRLLVFKQLFITVGLFFLRIKFNILSFFFVFPAPLLDRRMLARDNS